MADRQVDYLLIGGGIAAANCARWLRESGADGSILLVGRESDLPYNRPPCSKEYLQGSQTRADALFRPAEWYEDQQIEALTRVSAMKLDLDSRTVKLSNKDELQFGQALLASGANVRRLNVPGSELDGIHYLRAFGNADTIREDAAGKRVTLIGGSYIACEVAASLTLLGSSCMMVMLEPVTLSRGFGATAGRFFQERLEEHGVTIHAEQELERFEGAEGRVTRVITTSGLELETDAVVLGTGAVPDVMLARAAGLELGASGGVRVDERLQTGVSGLYAAGDVAEYHSVIHDGRPLRIEHWDVALNQGRVAALNMLGRGQSYDVVPYFFSDLADWASLEYVGPASDWDLEVVRGSLDEGEFSVWYLSEGRVAAALSVGRSEDLDHARRLIAAGTSLDGRAAELGRVEHRPRVALVRRGQARVARGGSDPAARRAAARQAIHQSSEPIDRSLQRSGHLDRALERREHADQLTAGIGHPLGAVDDLATSVIDAIPELDDLAAFDIDAISELPHLAPELEQLAGAAVELFREHHHRFGTSVEPLGDLEYRTADQSDLLAQVEHPLELCGGGAGRPGDGTEIGHDAVEDRLRGFDGETEEAQPAHLRATLRSAGSKGCGARTRTLNSRARTWRVAITPPRSKSMHR